MHLRVLSIMASAMRRLVTSLLALSLAAAAFALAACGGDDNKDNSNDSSKGTLTLQQPGTAQAPTGPTATGTDQTGTNGKKKKRSSGSNGSNSQTNAQQGGSKKKDKVSKELAEALSPAGRDKVSYEAARTVCRERTIKEIRATYKVKKKGNDAIANAVGRQYYPARRARAAVKGCAKGLSER